MHERAGGDDDADVRDRAAVDGEEDEVALAEVAAIDAVAGRRLLAARVRGSATPTCAKTYRVKPLQSKPPGSVPPFR